MSSAVFLVNKGSDYEFVFNWPDEVGNADLTGWTVSSYDADERIEPNLSFQITDEATGEIQGRIEWDAAHPIGKDLPFRVMIALGSENRTTNLLCVRYQ